MMLRIGSLRGVQGSSQHSHTHQLNLHTHSILPHNALHTTAVLNGLTGIKSKKLLSITGKPGKRKRLDILSKYPYYKPKGPTSVGWFIAQEFDKQAKQILEAVLHLVL